MQDPDTLAKREADLEAKMAELDRLSHALRDRLDAALKRELEKERLRLQWTDQSGSFKRFTHEVCLILCLLSIIHITCLRVEAVFHLAFFKILTLTFVIITACRDRCGQHLWIHPS
tara:strand:- start:438 stop:785 length:348 start_codon:yes stop_codon:yes gene_type:complete